MDQFFTEHEKPVYRFLLRLCRDSDRAGDLTQETLLKAWERRHEVRHEAARKSWLFRIAVNLWKDGLRRRKAAVMSAEVDQCGHEPTPEQMASHDELAEQIWQAIGRLPERQQQVMHLRAVEQLEISEIADVLGIGVQLVRSNLAVARRKLRTQFQDYLDH